MTDIRGLHKEARPSSKHGILCEYLRETVLFGQDLHHEKSPRQGWPGVT